MVFMCNRFDKPTSIAFSNLESYLIQLVKSQGIADEKESRICARNI